MGGHRPSHDETREQIEHVRHIEPALSSPDPSDVRDPPCVGRISTEVAVQEIGCHWITVLAIRRDGVSPPSVRMNPSFLHQPHYAFARTGHTLFGQFCLDASAAIDVVTGLMRLLDVACQDLIGLRVLAEGTPLPLVCTRRIASCLNSFVKVRCAFGIGLFPFRGVVYSKFRDSGCWCARQIYRGTRIIERLPLRGIDKCIGGCTEPLHNAHSETHVGGKLRRAKPC